MRAFTFSLLLLTPPLTNAFFTQQPTPVHTPPSSITDNKHENLLKTVQHAGLTLIFSMAMFVAPMDPSSAADFSKKDISGQDFSGQDLAGKDFTSTIAKGTNFQKANLAGANFQKAMLEKADFTGADLQGAKFEDAALDFSIFKDVTAQKATFSSSILDVADFENADLTDSLWPSKFSSRLVFFGSSCV